MPSDFRGTTSIGSLVQVHWRTGPITNMADVNAGFKAAGDLPTLLHLEQMNRGLYAAARGEYKAIPCSTGHVQESCSRSQILSKQPFHNLEFSTTVPTYEGTCVPGGYGDRE